MAFQSPAEVVGYIAAAIDAEKATLGISRVFFGEQTLVPEYPSVSVVPGPMDRTLHATRQFMLVFNIEIRIYHGNLKMSVSQRSDADMALARAVTVLLHDDPTLGGNLDLPGFVTSEDGGIMGRGMGTDRPTFVVGTRLTWRGQTREVFSSAGGF